jgi:acetyltransferase
MQNMITNKWATGVDLLSCNYTTKDGRVLQLRLIQAADTERLVNFFYSLSAESRWRRFHIATEHLDQATVHNQAQAFAAVDNWQRGGAVVALYQEPTAGAAAATQIVGVARLARGEVHMPETGADIAMVVRDDFQQQGVGHALLQQLVRLARHMDITHLHADVQADNAPALRVLKKLGLPITTQTRYAHTETTIMVQ